MICSRSGTSPKTTELGNKRHLTGQGEASGYAVIALPSRLPCPTLEGGCEASRLWYVALIAGLPCQSQSLTVAVAARLFAITQWNKGNNLTQHASHCYARIRSPAAEQRERRGGATKDRSPYIPLFSTRLGPQQEHCTGGHGSYTISSSIPIQVQG